MTRRGTLRVGCVAALAALGGCRGGPVRVPCAAHEAAPAALVSAPAPPLGPARSAGPAIPAGFIETDFGGEGLARIAESSLELDPGVPLSGVTWTGAAPAPPYALEVEFTKRYGNDFPCAVTFPVAGSHLTLVLGGWGGTVCGLSSLDGLDAARNATRFLHDFPAGVRVRATLHVTDERVRAWLDGAPVVDVALAGRVVGLRAELEPQRPLGLAAFATATVVHSVRWGPLPGPAGRP